MKLENFFVHFAKKYSPSTAVYITFDKKATAKICFTIFPQMNIFIFMSETYVHTKMFFSNEKSISYCDSGAFQT